MKKKLTSKTSVIVTAIYIYIYIYMIYLYISNIQSASEDNECGLFVCRIYEEFHIIFYIYAVGFRSSQFMRRAL